MELQLSAPTKLPFISAGLVTGKTVFGNVVCLLDGVITNLGQTYTEVGNGVYLINFTPASTGHLEIFIEGTLQVKADIVSKTSLGILKDLSDEALGSWAWDKSSGILTLYKSDSTVLATYNVVDTVNTASRERVS